MAANTAAAATVAALPLPAADTVLHSTAPKLNQAAAEAAVDKPASSVCVCVCVCSWQCACAGKESAVPCLGALGEQE